jgi:hypothetical protein
VPRRVSLPGADELFRRTRFPEASPVVETDAPVAAHLDGQAEAQTESRVDAQADAHTVAQTDRREDAGTSRPSGRVRHDEKITIYVTADELLTLEHTRLALRAHHGVAVDRGRIVREAIHLALQGVADHGDDSALVRRLREQ